jgi:hypothetical protein
MTYRVAGSLARRIPGGGFCRRKLLSGTPPKTSPPTSINCLASRQPIRYVVYQHVLNRQRWAGSYCLHSTRASSGVLHESPEAVRELPYNSGLLGLPTWPYEGCRHSGSGNRVQSAIYSLHECILGAPRTVVPRKYDKLEYGIDIPSLSWLNEHR